MGTTESSSYYGDEEEPHPTSPEDDADHRRGGYCAADRRRADDDEGGEVQRSHPPTRHHQQRPTAISPDKATTTTSASRRQQRTSRHPTQSSNVVALRGVVLGRPKSGKTCLVRRLRGEDPFVEVNIDKEERRTDKGGVRQRRLGEGKKMMALIPWKRPPPPSTTSPGTEGGVEGDDGSVVEEEGQNETARLHIVECPSLRDEGEGDQSDGDGGVASALSSSFEQRRGGTTGSDGRGGSSATTPSNSASGTNGIDFVVLMVDPRQKDTLDHVLRTVRVLWNLPHKSELTSAPHSGESDGGDGGREAKDDGGTEIAVPKEEDETSSSQRSGTDDVDNDDDEGEVTTGAIELDSISNGRTEEASSVPADSRPDVAGLDGSRPSQQTDAADALASDDTATKKDGGTALVSVCILLNFRDEEAPLITGKGERSPSSSTKATTPTPEQVRRALISELSSPSSSQPVLPVRVHASSMVNCYGLRPLHDFISLPYLSRKEQDLARRLKQVHDEKTKLMGADQLEAVEGNGEYEEFVRALGANTASQRGKRSEKTVRKEEMTEKEEEKAATSREQPTDHGRRSTDFRPGARREVISRRPRRRAREENDDEIVATGSRDGEDTACSGSADEGDGDSLSQQDTIRRRDAARRHHGARADELIMNGRQRVDASENAGVDDGRGRRRVQFGRLPQKGSVLTGPYSDPKATLDAFFADDDDDDEEEVDASSALVSGRDRRRAAVIDSDDEEDDDFFYDDSGTRRLSHLLSKNGRGGGKGANKGKAFSQANANASRSRTNANKVSEVKGGGQAADAANKVSDPKKDFATTADHLPPTFTSPKKVSSGETKGESDMHTSSGNGTKITSKKSTPPDEVVDEVVYEEGTNVRKVESDENKPESASKSTGRSSSKESDNEPLSESDLSQNATTNATVRSHHDGNFADKANERVGGKFVSNIQNSFGAEDNESSDDEFMVHGVEECDQDKRLASKHNLPSSKSAQPQRLTTQSKTISGAEGKVSDEALAAIALAAKEAERMMNDVEAVEQNVTLQKKKKRSNGASKKKKAKKKEKKKKEKHEIETPE